MGLFADLENKVSTYAKEKFVIDATNIIPDISHQKLTFGNTGLSGEFTFMFVDIRSSSHLSEIYGHEKAAKIYQCFHEINVNIINDNDGEVRAFDGDRIMGIFGGNGKNNNSVKAAMQIQWAITNILNTNLFVKIECGVGIDYGDTLITKIGKGRNKNNNDLIWVGKPINYASRLVNEAENKILISEEVYNRLVDSRLYSHGILIWKLKHISLKSGKKILCYESNYTWELS